MLKAQPCDFVGWDQDGQEVWNDDSGSEDHADEEEHEQGDDADQGADASGRDTDYDASTPSAQQAS